MPKVLIIVNRFNLGGITSNVCYLTKYLYPEYETLLIGGTNEKYEASSDYIVEKMGVQAIKIPEMVRSIGFKDIKAYIKIRNIIKQYKPDIVHTHASKAGVLGRLAAISCKVPVIVHTFHGHIFNSYFSKPITEAFRLLEKYLAKRTSGIVAISNIQKQELTEVYKIAPASKFHVIPLGFDLEEFRENIDKKRIRFRKKYDISDSDIAVSTVGRLVPVKNHKMFISAIKNVNMKTNKHVRGVIVGDGELKESLIAYAESLGLTYSTPEKQVKDSDLIFTSWIQDADFVFAGSDISALTSLNEGTPVSIIESQAANVPVVSTIVGGIRDIVIEGKTALLSASTDVDAFSENLLMLADNDELRYQMSVDGWEFVRERFHYTRLIDDMKNLYQELLSSK